MISLFVQNPFFFDVIAGFAKLQWFSYMGIAFSLLAMNLTLNYWTSIYFIGHVAIILVYAFSWLAPDFKVKSGEWESVVMNEMLCSSHKHNNAGFRLIIVIQSTIFSQ